jgi:hypothetical protein
MSMWFAENELECKRQVVGMLCLWNSLPDAPDLSVEEDLLIRPSLLSS